MAPVKNENGTVYPDGTPKPSKGRQVTQGNDKPNSSAPDINPTSPENDIQQPSNIPVTENPVESRLTASGVIRKNIDVFTSDMIVEKAGIEAFPSRPTDKITINPRVRLGGLAIDNTLMRTRKTGDGRVRHPIEVSLGKKYSKKYIRNLVKPKNATDVKYLDIPLQDPTLKPTNYLRYNADMVNEDAVNDRTLTRAINANSFRDIPANSVRFG